MVRKQKLITEIEQQIPPLKALFIKEFGEADKYPNGKYLFEKGNQLIEDVFNSYESEPDLGLKIEAGNYAISILEKILALNGTDTKDLNKKLKKLLTSAEIKLALEL